MTAQDPEKNESGPDTRSTQGGGAVLGTLMRPLNTLVERFIPSALVFAIALTFIVAVLALILTDAGPVTVVEEWGMGAGRAAGFHDADGTHPSAGATSWPTPDLCAGC